MFGFTMPRMSRANRFSNASFTGQSLFAAGSASAPSAAFVQTNLGIYQSATNVLGVAAGGEPQWLWATGSSTMGSWSATAYQMNAATGGAGNTDRAGRALLIGSGKSTGSGLAGYVGFQVTPAGATGSTENTYVTVGALHHMKAISNNSATAMVNCTLASNTVVAGRVSYAVEVFDGTDVQIEEGVIVFHATNKGGVIANNTVVKFGNQQAMTSGTLTATWTITAANPAVLTLNANSSLTPSAGYPRITLDISNLTQQAIALL